MNNSNPTYRIIDIIRGTSVDGPGFRTSIYFAGCLHKCEGCHNPQSWDMAAGHDMTLSQIMEIIEEEDFDVTLSGGDPLYQWHNLPQLISAVNSLGHTVWIYTGFTLEEILADFNLLKAIAQAEAIVEGRFIKELKNDDLKFKGSSNQRIIYLNDLKK